MQRHALLALAAAYVFGAADVLAQGGDLAGVTMRVLDDVSDVDAVVLELDASRGEDAEGASADGNAEGDAEKATDEEGSRAARRDAPADEARRPDNGERDELHDADADERAEGRLEDRDVERPAAPPAAVP